MKPIQPKRERITENASGLLVVRYEMTAEQKRQRRIDNKRMKEIHKKVRKRKKHGRR